MKGEHSSMGHAHFWMLQAWLNPGIAQILTGVISCSAKSNTEVSHLVELVQCLRTSLKPFPIYVPFISLEEPSHNFAFAELYLPCPHYKISKVNCILLTLDTLTVTHNVKNNCLYIAAVGQASACYGCFFFFF